MTTLTKSATAPATDPLQRIYTLYGVASTAGSGSIQSYEQLRAWNEARKGVHHRPLEESLTGLEHLLQTSQEKRNALAQASVRLLTVHPGVTRLLQLAAGGSVLFCLSLLLW
jgi:hypothetical protein